MLRKILSKILFILCIVVIVISSYKILTNLYEGYEVKNESIKQTKEYVENYENDKELKINFKKLKSHNKDSVAWIKIDDTPISYPVVHIPNDNKTYLTTNFDGKHSLSGTLFLDGNNSPNFNDKVSFIFGHNVATSLTFGKEVFFTSLHNYANINYLNNHKTIKLYTSDDKIHTYKIFAQKSVTETTDLYKTSFASDSDFENYINKLNDIKIADDVKLDKNSKILILSTCLEAIEGTTERRLVFAKKEN